MSEVNVQQKKIGENAFYVRPMPPDMALSLLGDLQAVVTGSLNNNMNDVDGKTDVNLGALIAGIGGKLNGPALVGFADRILNKEYVSVDVLTSRGNETVKLDIIRREEIFTGHVMDMISLMWFVLEVNYKDFFDSLPDLSGIQELIVMKK